MGTLLAYRIAKRYYNNKHYVWCTNRFHSKEQPPTSDPLTIGNTYLRHVVGGDRHSDAIKNNIVGILSGAEQKLRDGVIDDATHELICQMVNCADYEAFVPVLFVINTRLVKDRCREVDISRRASDRSIEYNIVDLAEGEFQIINFKELLAGVVDAFDGKAGK